MNYTELDAEVFKKHLESDPNHFLIDVREVYEFEEENIGGVNIPMGDILSRLNDLKDNQSIYLYCRSGKRSRAIAHHLAKLLKQCQIYWLKGGIIAYKEAE